MQLITDIIALRKLAEDNRRATEISRVNPCIEGKLTGEMEISCIGNGHVIVSSIEVERVSNFASSVTSIDQNAVVTASNILRGIIAGPPGHHAGRRPGARRSAFPSASRVNDCLDLRLR